MFNRLSAIIILILLLQLVTIAETNKIQADKAESSITYQLTHPLHEIESTSKETYCIIDADISKKEITSVSVQVDVSTFDSGNSNRDSHAMEVVEALFYPDARFTSTSITQEGDSIKVTGNLTFHGLTKEIVISAKTKWTGDKLSVTGFFNISLTEFKIERPSLLFVPVEDTLRFSLLQVFKLK